MPQISFDDLVLDFKLRRSQRTKRLQIIFKNPSFEVVAPPRMSNQTILSFVWEKRKWMARAFAYSNNLREAEPVHFWSEDKLLFRGRWWPLVIELGARPEVVVLEDKIVCSLPIHTKQAIQKALVDFLRQQTLMLAQATVDVICPQLERWPKRMVLRQQKTRWGSCGINDVISLNWHLIFGPEGILEYVVAHELCHLIHRNHGVRFWQKVAKVCPQHEGARRWLRKDGRFLMNIVS